MEKERLLADFFNTCGRAGAANLIGADFNNVRIHGVATKFPQGRKGLRVEFEISHHAVGKMGAASEPLWNLAKMCGVDEGEV